MNYTIEIERMAYGADAIGHLPDGKTVFVEGGAPGDTVEVEITEDKGAFARGKIARIEEASRDRVNPLSPIDELCRTAPWQHLSYRMQLSAKRANVVAALVHTAHFDPTCAEEVVEGCLGSRREWNYRNKLELACFTGRDGKLALGFHCDGASEPVAAESSKLVHKAIEKAPKALRGALRYAQSNQELGIHRVGVRHSLATGELEIALWTRPSSFPRAVFAKTLSNTMKTTSIVRVLADPGKARKVKGVETLDGRGYWRERIGDIEFSTQAPSFFQVNTAQAAKLIETTISCLGNIDGAYVADLYAGGGTFSIPLAIAGADVVAVEAAKSSVRDLRYNAEANGIDLEVVGGDATRELPELGRLDALVVDPPRAGLTSRIIDSVASAAPERIVYISCDPATWARDVARLGEIGYRLECATPIDMFPQTFHTEIVSVFST